MAQIIRQIILRITRQFQIKQTQPKIIKLSKVTRQATTRVISLNKTKQLIPLKLIIQIIPLTIKLIKLIYKAITQIQIRQVTKLQIIKQIIRQQIKQILQI